jgi:hypothetical protein
VCHQPFDIAPPTIDELQSTAFVPAESRPAMWVAAFVGALFAIGAVYNIYVNGLISGDAAADVFLSSACFWLFTFMKREAQWIGEFHRWLKANTSALESGGAAYRGLQLDLDSEVTQFQAAFSLLIVTFSVQSRPYVVGQDVLWLPGMTYAVYSMLFGWWGLPWGPIRTIAALIINGSGGNRRLLRELVAEAKGNVRSIFRLTPSAGQEIRRVIAERGFATGTAVRVVPLDPIGGEYTIEYDLPINDGRDWQVESEKLIVLVDKSAVESWNLGEIVVDFKDGQFCFERTSR